MGRLRACSGEPHHGNPQKLRCQEDFLELHNMRVAEVAVVDNFPLHMLCDLAGATGNKLDSNLRPERLPLQNGCQEAKASCSASTGSTARPLCSKLSVRAAYVLSGTCVKCQLRHTVLVSRKQSDGPGNQSASCCYIARHMLVRWFVNKEGNLNKAESTSTEVFDFLVAGVTRQRVSVISHVSRRGCLPDARLRPRTFTYLLLA